MKLFLALLMMGIALAGLIVLLKPQKKKALPAKKKKSAPALKAKSKKPVAASPTEQAASAGEPTMEEIRIAVRRYVTKFPGVTADVMNDWMKKQ